MANITPSANMNLPIPTVGVDPAPDWALNVDTCLTLIDQHDHSPGFGVQITPAGLDINGDLSFGTNNAIAVRSLRLQPQSAPLSGATDVGCVYESGGDLWYNSAAANQVQLTSGGSVVGAPGTISGLFSPASATYVSSSSTFVWQSAAATPANMDAGAYIFRNITASSFGLTLQPPTLSSNYTLTLPKIPSVTSIMQMDNAGNMSAVLTVDNVTLGISANVLQVAAQGISTNFIADGAVTTVKIANGAITEAKLASASVGTNELINGSVTEAKLAAASVGTAEIITGAITQVKIASAAVGTLELINGSVTSAKLAALNINGGTNTGSFSTGSDGTTITGLTLSTTGRPVVVQMTSFGGTPASIKLTAGGTFGIYLDGTNEAGFQFSGAVEMSPYAVGMIIFPAAGTHTIQLRSISLSAFGSVMSVTNCQINAYEL